MPLYARIQKRVGETPLQALGRFRATDPRLASVPLTYAGRLDPMASGELLILIGEACKRREQYDGLDKIYDFEVLFGLSSDTDDVLGMPQQVRACEIPETAIRTAIESLVGTHELPYPAFSSKTVNGVPLHAYARSGQPVERPAREMTVRSISYRGSRLIAAATLRDEILDKLAQLTVPASNDFRVDAIRTAWRAILATNSSFRIIAAMATVSSGTYIRALAPYLAARLGTNGLAYRIHRSAIVMPT